MIETMLAINFIGMIAFPIIGGVYFSRNLNISWKLFLAGNLTFINMLAYHYIDLPTVPSIPPEQLELAK